MNDLDFAKAVRARLLEYGHRTGGLGPPEGPNCVLGAAYIVDGLEIATGPVFGLVFRAYAATEARMASILGTVSPAFLNDRAPQEVIPRLDRYIETTEALQAACEALAEPEPVHA